MKKKLYIDIDGVLLGRKKAGEHEIGLAMYAKELLELSLKHYECFWLTTHCTEENTEQVIKRLREYCDDEFLELARKVKATIWKNVKTNAIDFSSDFYWIEDSPLWYETNILKEKRCLKRLIRVDTRERPDDLKRAIKVLKASIS